MIAELAARQHGVVTRRQLLAAGVGDHAIKHRLAVKRLEHRHDGVYELGGRKRDQTTLFIAAVLACGDGAALTDRSAAAHLGLRPQSAGPVHVAVPRSGPRHREGVRIHRPRNLGPEDIIVVDGIPCATPARAVVDCAATLPRGDVKRMIERAEIERIFHLPEFEAAAARPGHRGAKIVRGLLTDLTDSPPTRSEFEHSFLSLIDSVGLPRPIVNGIVCGHEVDFHWPHAKLIVETDGAETHATLTAFYRDRNRDVDLALAEWHVIRITWRQLRDEPQRIVGLLRAKLGCL